MTCLLFPGRHLLNTAFQAQYLRSIVQMPLAALDFLAGPAPAGDLAPINQIVFAITSANQAHSRYNPIPLHVRAIGVDRFARPFEMAFGISYRIIAIPHYQPTPRFARYTLKEIQEQTEGNLTLTPANCVVLCSTPAVIEQYRALGFAILPAELGQPDAATPNDLLQKLVAAGEAWFTNRELRQALSPATFDLWQDFPDIPRRILRLWRDPLLNDEGGLTSDRDYASYAFGMSNNEIIAVKYDDIKEAIVPGKIVDEGCGDGALLVPIARDFPDSDLIGIEITGEFMARAQERQRAGHFGGSYVHFHQRNITQQIFEPNAIDTTICNSTVHELWSYGDRQATVAAYLANKLAQTRPGGRLIIRDVVGPPGKDQEVAMRLNDQDGGNDDIFADFADPHQLAAHLAGLSTYARFQRFARDFLAEARTTGRRGPETALQYRETRLQGEPCIFLALKDAVEFMTKKDYVNNWASEMHEEFAFWDFAEWQGALRAAGFRVVVDGDRPGRGSRVYTSQWIVDHRWQGKVALFQPAGDQLLRLPYPPTNIVLVGEKR